MFYFEHCQEFQSHCCVKKVEPIFKRSQFFKISKREKSRDILELQSFPRHPSSQTHVSGPVHTPLTQPEVQWAKERQIICYLRAWSIFQNRMINTYQKKLRIEKGIIYWSFRWYGTPLLVKCFYWVIIYEINNNCFVFLIAYRKL